MSSNNCSSCSDSGWFVQMADPDVLDSALLHFFSAYFAEFRSLHCSCAAEVADFPAGFFIFVTLIFVYWDRGWLHFKTLALHCSPFTFIWQTLSFSPFSQMSTLSFSRWSHLIITVKITILNMYDDDQWVPPHPHSPPRRWLHWCGARCRPSCHKTVNLKPNQI